MEELSKLDSASIKPAVEALLLVSDEAVTPAALAGPLEVAPAEVAQALSELAREYAAANRGFQLREVAGGWRLFTHPAYHEQVERLVLSWDARRLSQAALEVLAVIAYHQPVTREGVRAIRGVNSDGVIASLREKGLVREVGGGKGGQAATFGTTRAFLERFGLRSVADLPPLEDFAPDEESKRFIRERLSGGVLAADVDATADDLDEERELLGDDYGEDDEDEGLSSRGPEPGAGGTTSALGGVFDDIEGSDE